MACYRNGGCGPYEMYSCSECPASKPEYAKAKDYPPYLDYPKEQKKQTNADRLRQMSDEELAEWICQETTNALNLLSFGNDKPSKSFFTWLDWLKQEVQDAAD